jgi:hypothetical protein
MLQIEEGKILQRRIGLQETGAIGIQGDQRNATETVLTLRCLMPVAVLVLTKEPPVIRLDHPDLILRSFFIAFVTLNFLADADLGQDFLLGTAIPLRGDQLIGSYMNCIGTRAIGPFLGQRRPLYSNWEIHQHMRETRDQCVLKPVTGKQVETASDQIDIAEYIDESGRHIVTEVEGVGKHPPDQLLHRAAEIIAQHRARRPLPIDGSVLCGMARQKAGTGGLHGESAAHQGLRQRLSAGHALKAFRSL